MADLKDLIELKTSLDAEEVRELHLLRALNARLLEALKEIENPISYMRGRLRGDERLDGVQAIVLANNAAYLREIARTAIAEAETQSPTNATT